MQITKFILTGFTAVLLQSGCTAHPSTELADAAPGETKDAAPDAATPLTGSVKLTVNYKDGTTENFTLANDGHYKIQCTGMITKTAISFKLLTAEDCKSFPCFEIQLIRSNSKGFELPHFDKEYSFKIKTQNTRCGGYMRQWSDNLGTPQTGDGMYGVFGIVLTAQRQYGHCLDFYGAPDSLGSARFCCDGTSALDGTDEGTLRIENNKFLGLTWKALFEGHPIIESVTTEASCQVS